MACSSWIQSLFKEQRCKAYRSPEIAESAGHSLQLATECVSRVRMRAALPQDVKFCEVLCKYLSTKLEKTVSYALLHYDHVLAEDSAKSLDTGLYKILLLLAEEVDGLTERCCKGNWIQAAVVLPNLSDHVWSMSLDLEMCTIFFSVDNSPCLSSEDVSYLRSLELQRVKEKALIDDVTLSARLQALIESGAASDDAHELATFVLARIPRLRQQSLRPGTSESSQLSLVHERADISSLKYEERIGKGGFATVHRASWRGVEVAVKTFHGPENPEFKKEVSICEDVCHLNIASFLFYGVDNGECSIVMELMDGDLQSLMRSRLRCNRSRKSPFCFFVELHLMLQIAEGMSYLHRLRIVHRDLKSHNILVRCAKPAESGGDEYVHAKVADFGLARTKEKSMTYSDQTPNKGTTRWMAPEMFGHGSLVKKEGYPFKSDVYSFAMLCYEIMTGDYPFSNVYEFAEIRRKVLTGDRPELPDRCPSKLRELITTCWSPDERARPSFADICLELRYLKSLQTSWSGVETYASSTSVECVTRSNASMRSDDSDLVLAVQTSKLTVCGVNKQEVTAEIIEAESQPEVSTFATVPYSLAYKVRLTQFERELQELLIAYSLVIPLGRQRPLSQGPRLAGVESK